jgi:hypothetical protein
MQRKQVGECWVCVIFFTQVVVFERMRRACRGVRGGAVRKTGPRSNKIKQMQKQNIEDTQYKRNRFTWFTQCGIRPPEKLPGPSFIIIQQMKGYNLQQNPL